MGGGEDWGVQTRVEGDVNILREMDTICSAGLCKQDELAMQNKLDLHVTGKWNVYTNNSTYSQKHC